jgi:hypothetical protein
VICTARIASAPRSAHRHDQLAAEDARPAVRNRRAVHRHVAAFFDMAQRDPFACEHVLERERAADREHDEIVAPQRFERIDALGQPAVAVHVVARHVGAHVEIRAEHVDPERARLADTQQRTRLRIRMTEAQEIVRMRVRQDGEVRLRERPALAGRRAAERAAAYGPAEF